MLRPPYGGPVNFFHKFMGYDEEKIENGAYARYERNSCYCT